MTHKLQCVILPRPADPHYCPGDCVSLCCSVVWVPTGLLAPTLSFLSIADGLTVSHFEWKNREEDTVICGDPSVIPLSSLVHFLKTPMMNNLAVQADADLKFNSWMFEKWICWILESCGEVKSSFLFFVLSEPLGAVRHFLFSKLLPLLFSVWDQEHGWTGFLNHPVIKDG